MYPKIWYHRNTFFWVGEDIVIWQAQFSININVSKDTLGQYLKHCKHYKHYSCDVLKVWYFLLFRNNCHLSWFFGEDRFWRNCVFGVFRPMSIAEFVQLQFNTYQNFELLKEFLRKIKIMLIQCFLPFYVGKDNFDRIDLQEVNAGFWRN